MENPVDYVWYFLFQLEQKYNTYYCLFLNHSFSSRNLNEACCSTENVTLKKLSNLQTEHNLKGFVNAEVNVLQSIN